MIPGAGREVSRRTVAHPVADLGGGGWRAGGGVRVEARPDAELLLDPLLDLVGGVLVLAQEITGVLLALAQLVAFVGVPGAGLAHDSLLYAEIDKAETYQNEQVKDMQAFEFTLTCEKGKS